MALTSPGVEVTVIDQSQYLPAPTNSVPLVVIATAQNKANPAGTGVALGTTAANAGKLYQMTSQKDLADFYGIPFFYTTTNGTPIQGYELNEYGLLAAYSLLGTTNRCYVLRADIDLSSLVGQTGRPTGAPADGTYWLDTTNTDWGIFEFNATTGRFTKQIPIVISDTAYISGGYPLNSIGNTGDYAINATVTGNPGNPISPTQYFYKNYQNTWVTIGTRTWAGSWPTVQGTQSNPTLTAGNTFTINLNNLFSTTITVPASTNNTVTGVASAINSLGYRFLRAEVISGKLNIYSQQNPGSSVNAQNQSLVIGAGSGTVLADLGIDTGTYYQPVAAWGSSAEMPLWTASQQYPHPTGSLWIKTDSAGLGLSLSLSRYNAITAAFRSLNVGQSTADWAYSAANDATGGAATAAGTVYAQYNYNQQIPVAPVYLWERLAVGPTVVTASETNVLASATGTIYVQVSTPNSSVLSGNSNTASGYYEVSITTGMTATQFVTAWQTATIPYTTASVTTDGAIQLVHTEGGEIVMDDYIRTAGATYGTSTDIIATAGFVVNSTTSVKYGPQVPLTFNVAITSTSGSGINGVISVSPFYTYYNINGTGVITAGTGYAVGDTITVTGINLGGATGANNFNGIVTGINGSGGITSITTNNTGSSLAVATYATQLSNWVSLTFTPNEGAPTQVPANNTNWYWSVVDQVDIMVNYNGQWNGYKNVNYDSTGFPTNIGANATDPNGPIISASMPTTQSDGTALVYGDLWIDTGDLENYPIISRWEMISGVDTWVVLDNANQTSSTGVVFADARWSSDQDMINPANDPIPTIASLLTSDYLDIDAPSSSLYPSGMLLFNTRRSGYNVKEWKVNYFNSLSFPGATIPTIQSTWVSVSGLQSNGSPYMGRQAQRAMVVKSLRSVIDTNTDIRDEDNFFNLMATPYYPELQPNMVVLNADRGETAYIIGDTPMRLPDNATAIQAWATNAAGATSTGEQGCVTRNTYLGLFYPSGLTSDLSGNIVAVPPSHMMLRTFLRNDTVSYPWLAAAGTRRGNIDNATNIGYLDAATGEFITIKTRLGIRDVLYINFINPLVFFTGVGLLNYGNKTSFNSASALDRTNVARLIAYIRRQLTLATRPFVFEPNDALTRNQVAGVVQTLLVDLVAKRGLYDYLVICDESNNTPARIDRNELWIDVAVEPVKAAEFIYIPVRVLNTGEIAGLQ